MKFSLYQLRDEMDSPMMEPLRNWNQPVSDRMGIESRIVSVPGFHGQKEEDSNGNCFFLNL